MMDALLWVVSLAPTVLTGVAIFYLQRAQKRRDKKEETRIQTRRREIRLMIDLQIATAKLAYATAEAIKRGKANGEVEEGIGAYKEALEEFREFERDQISRL